MQALAKLLGLDANREAGYEPTPLRRLKDIIDRQERLSGILPYSAYLKEEKVFVNDDSIGFVLEARPQTGADDEMARILATIFQICPTGAGVQFTLYGSPSILRDLKAYANQRQPDAGQDLHEYENGRPRRNENVFRTQVRRRVSHYLKGATGSMFAHIPYLLRNYRLIVSVTVPGSGTEAELEKLLALRDSVSATLVSAMLPAVVWTAEDLVKFLAEVLNPHVPPSDDPPTYDDGRLIKAQVIERDTVCRVGRFGLRFSKAGDPENEIEVRHLSVKSYPGEAYVWNMSNMIGDLFQNSLQYPCPFMITMGVHILDYEATKAKAQIKSARATTNSTSAMAKFLPDMAERKRDWDIVMQALGNGQSLVSVYHEVALFARPEEANMAEQNAKAIFRTRNFELTNDVFMQAQALVAALPMGLSEDMHRDMQRTLRVSTKTAENAAHLAPVIAEWSGSKTPVITLFGRRGQIMTLSLFDNDKGNYNAAIVGTSGSGKSVFTNDLAVSYRSTGAHVWIIDVGRSYEKSCRLVDGEFIEFTPDSDIKLNPFSLVRDIAEEMELLKPLIGLMAHPKQDPGDMENMVIEKAILAEWQSKRGDMTITDLVARLELMAQESKDVVSETAHQLARLLFSYTNQGMYGTYFDGPCNVNLKNGFTVLELEELNKKKNLQGVVLMILFYAIQQEVYLNRDTPHKKIVILDEAWDLLGLGDGTAHGKSGSGAFIATGYRRLRKYGGAFCCASQSINDFYDANGKSVILDNSDWMFILRQKPEAVEQLARSGRLNMDDALKRIVTSVKTESGYYSEVYVRSALGQGVGRLMVDPYSLLMYSTKAEDFTAIQQKRALGLDTAQAIEAVLKDRGIA